MASVNTASDPPPPPAVDTATPNVARIYDYLLGGTSNYACDREAATDILAALPDGKDVMRANRAFQQRAVRYLAGEVGITQFIDIGAGLPTQGNVHEIAHRINPRARVVYVDNDPVVLAHSRAILNATANVVAIRGDLRYPEQIIEHPTLRALVDLGRPVAILLVAIVHFIGDNDDPYGVLAQLKSAIPPGSYLALSHGEERPEVSDAARVYDRSPSPATVRRRDQIASFFDGLQLVEPGLVGVTRWRPEDNNTEDIKRVWMLGGLGRKH